MKEKIVHHFTLPTFALFDLMNTLSYLSGVIELKFELIEKADETEKEFDHWIWAIEIVTNTRHLSISSILLYAYYFVLETTLQKKKYIEFVTNIKKSKVKKFVIKEFNKAEKSVENDVEKYNFVL